MSSNGDMPQSVPRLCHMVLSPDFKGYGFNLHTVKEKPGQFIGQVDEGSPAEKAMLKQGDRIVEVNGVNIANENHKQVVARVKAIDNETRLLVVDREADAWYKEHNIVVTSHMPEVLKASSLTRRPSSVSSDVKSDDLRSVGSVGSGSSAVNSEPTDTQADEVSYKEDQYDNINFVRPSEEMINNDKNEEKNTQDLHHKMEEIEIEAKVETRDHQTEVEKTRLLSTEVEEEDNEARPQVDEARHEVDDKSSSDGGDSLGPSAELARSVSSASSSSQGATVPAKSPVSTSPTPPSSVGSPSPTPNNAPHFPGLNLNMSAAEMRAYLASKKKRDIRQDSIDMKKKHQIIQRL